MLHVFNKTRGVPARIVANLLAALVLFSALPPTALGAQPARIAIVLTPHQTYRNAATVIQRDLISKNYEILVIELPQTLRSGPSQPASTPSTGKADTTEAEADEDLAKPDTALPLSADTRKALDRLAEAKPTLIVTMGQTVTFLVLEAVEKTPVVYCMLQNAPDSGLMDEKSPYKARIAGVTTDIPAKHYLSWIAKLHPQTRNIGVLYSDRSERTAESIALAAGDVSLSVTRIKTSKTEFPKAIETLTSNKCDGVLMIADSKVYSLASVKRILLWGIRNKKAVWAFSENFVKAGALGGLYVDTEAIGGQTAEIVDRVLKGEGIATIGLQYPKALLSSINERTAEMIGISLDRQALEAVTVRHGKPK